MEKTIILIGFIQSLFGVLIFITKRPRHLSFSLLCFWLAVIAIFLGAGQLPFEVVDYYKPGIFPFLFLFGPLLYFYVSSLAIENFRLRYKHLLHLLPLIAVSIHRSTTEVVPITRFLNPENNNTLPLYIIYYILLITLMLAYWLFTVKLILNHRKNIPYYFSNYTARNTLNWLIFVVLIFLLLFFVELFFTLSSKIFHFNLNDVLSLPVNLTIFTFVMLFFGINQTVIFNFKKEDLNTAEETIEKYKRSVLDQHIIDDINIKVSNYLRAKKPYLNPEFSLQMMVDDLGISRHSLSQIINSGQNKNFYKLTNEYRIKEVKEKLANKEYKNLTVLGIAFECGFNSKTTFNRIFKEETGMTPTNYIKNLKSIKN